ncbi:lysophospholipid acyltransferase family protein [Neobacillus sp. PS3-40]|uniref:lysophospholipid acyltransferase family protein n=1 Tax=Neobacillus sp. PS3-40 TaxID=3070679 RepID=UPI0027DECB23|nr:lysophospholipid acyltransferase family protein [Neobacillus sp. PS3-40]WML45129.1 lysophospholipid acyltransferase family protein [Neobacillus sp. PS3-40]
MTFYTFARAVSKGILKSIYRFEIEGLEHIPAEGGVLICSNHINNFDPPVVGFSIPRPVYFMAKEELFSVPVLGWAIRKSNAFPVKRGMSDRDALRKGLTILKEGNILGLFPEGTRSKTGELGKGLSGAGFFASRSNAMVVPCAIIGPYKIFHKIKVVYGKPIEITEMRKQKASAEEVTEFIMSEIHKLILENK